MLIAGSGASLSSASFSGSLTNSGSITINPNCFVLLSLPYSSGGTITNNGTLAFNGNFTSTQGIAGTGTAVFNQQVSTGAGGTAALNIAGNADFASSTQWIARLSGPTRGSQYDALAAGGQLFLGGSLQVTLSGGFVPTLGQSFDLMDWGSRSGKFSSVTLPALSSGLAWSTLYFSATGAISVVDANLIPGDVNHDSQVNVADISALMGALSNLSGYKTARGLTGPSANANLLQIADINRDGQVNNLDIQAMIVAEANSIIGSLTIGGSDGSTMTVVPEPYSLVLACLGGLALLSHRRLVRWRPAEA